MDDLTSRQAAIDALEAQERQRATQKRRYTFGNNEFSLEAAYHDCKLVFDGITDDDSFQEADTGLILYYANEIIYALHEALEGKDINVLSNDCISRQAAIDVLGVGKKVLSRVLVDTDDVVGCEREKYSWGLGLIESYIKDIEELPSAQPELILCRDCRHWREGGVYSYCQKLFNCGVLDVHDYMRAEDDFCSLAERREE